MDEVADRGQRSEVDVSVAQHLTKQMWTRRSLPARRGRRRCPAARRPPKSRSRRHTRRARLPRRSLSRRKSSAGPAGRVHRAGDVPATRKRGPWRETRRATAPRNRQASRHLRSRLHWPQKRQVDRRDRRWRWRTRRGERQSRSRPDCLRRRRSPHERRQIRQIHRRMTSLVLGREDRIRARERRAPRGARTTPGR